MSINLDLINVFLLVTATANTFLGILIYVRNKQSAINKIYTVNIVAIVLWIIGMVIYRSATEFLIYWTKFLYLSPTLIASTFLLFSYFFPSGKKSLSYLKIWLIFIPNLILIPFISGGDFIIKNVIIVPGAEKMIFFGVYYWFFAGYIISYFSFGIFRLFIKFVKSNDAQARRQIQYLLGGYLIAANLGMLTNLILPWFGRFELNWLGQIFTLFMVVPVAYAILKYHLFDVKAIAAELLVVAISITLSIELFFSKNITEVFLRFALLVLVISFGYLLIKSVLQEIRSKEKIERLATDLEKANEELKRLDQAKSEFISIASHQLRTPLSIIKGYISMMREGSFGILSDALAKTVNKIYLSNERLIKLVNDLLDLSRMESGKLKYEFLDMDLKDLVSSIVDEFQIPAKDKGIKIMWQEPKEDLPPVSGDAWKLRQVFFNLLDNGLKYTDQGGGIEIKLEKADNFIKLSVHDSGVGMSSETAAAVFHKFARGKEGARVNTAGTGLGLYIAKKIIDDHHGRIWAESEGEGKGSTFNVMLPISANGALANQFAKILEHV